MNTKTTLSVGKGIEIEVDFDQFGEEVRDHLLLIGAKNVLRDVHAGVENGLAKERVENKLAALYRGELSTRQPGQTAALTAKVTAQEAEIAALREQLATAQAAAESKSSKKR